LIFRLNHLMREARISLKAIGWVDCTRFRFRIPLLNYAFNCFTRFSGSIG
jgi:hypothetical protein